MSNYADLIERLEAYRPTNEWGDPVHHVIADEAAACIRELVEWRPIETAPHETLVVLGWDEGGVWKQELALASAGQRWPTGASNMWWHGSATHWLPLPPAPGAEA